MKHMVLGIVTQDRNDEYHLVFPEYPLCTARGWSAEQAVSNAASLLAQALHKSISDGEEVKTPSTLSSVYEANRAVIEKGAMAISVEVDFPGKAVRCNITIEEGLLGRIDRAAREEGKSRSAFLAAAAIARLEAR